MEPFHPIHKYLIIHYEMIVKENHKEISKIFLLLLNGNEIIQYNLFKLNCKGKSPRNFKNILVIIEWI